MRKTIYKVYAYTWRPGREDDDPFSLDLMFRTENRDEAVAYFKNAEVSEDRPQWNLYADGPDEEFYLAMKDEHGIQTDYGIGEEVTE